MLDLVGGKQTRSIDLGEHGAPHGLRLLPGDRRVLVTTEGSASLLVVDIASGKVERVIDVGGGTGHMVALSPDAKFAYVTKINAGTVSRIDLASGVKTHERAAGKGAEGVAVSPDGREVWVANREDGTITVHDPAHAGAAAADEQQGFPDPGGVHQRWSPCAGDQCRGGQCGGIRRPHQVAHGDGRAWPRPARNTSQTMLGRAALPIGVVVDPSAPARLRGDQRWRPGRGDRYPQLESRGSLASRP